MRKITSERYQNTYLDGDISSVHILASSCIESANGDETSDGAAPAAEKLATVHQFCNLDQHKFGHYSIAYIH